MPPYISQVHARSPLGQNGILSLPEKEIFLFFYNNFRPVSNKCRPSFIKNSNRKALRLTISLCSMIAFLIDSYICCLGAFVLNFNPYYINHVFHFFQARISFFSLTNYPQCYSFWPTPLYAVIKDSLFNEKCLPQLEVKSRVDL